MVIADQTADPPGLKRELGLVQYLTIGVGAIVGIAWIIVLGDWLDAAGPLGAVLAFVAGAALMALVAACYSELATSMPFAGGEVVYAHVLFGPRTAFAIGWFLVLTATATTAFEAVSFARLLVIVFPRFQGAELYRAFGAPVTVGGLALSLGGTALMTAANVRGVKTSARLQDWFTFIKLAAVAVFLAACLKWGEVHNLPPLFHGSHERPAWIGMLWIAATAPFWFGGFQIIPQTIEERNRKTSLRAIGLAAVGSIFIGAAFYCSIIIAAAMSAPRQELSSGELPAAHAMQAVFGSQLMTKLVLLATIAGILATWNACTLWASRVLLALGRAGFVSAGFERVHPTFGTPTNAVCFVCALCALGACSGRSILLPVVNMGAISLAAVYVVCCVGVLRNRRLAPHRVGAFRVPGGRPTVFAATAGAVFMAIFVALEPLTRPHAWVPLEWTLLITWGALGVLCWRLRAGGEDGEDRQIWATSPQVKNYL